MGRVKRGYVSRILVPAIVMGTLISSFLVVSPSFASQQKKSDDPSSAYLTCRIVNKAFSQLQVDRSEIYTKNVVTLNKWSVPFRERNWKSAHPTNAMLTVRFYSLGWLIPRAQSEVAESMNLFAEKAQVNRDPWGSLPKRSLSQVGWSESAVTWRLRTSLCLYQIADSKQKEKILPGIEALILAAKDPRRYYGPPNARPHNHGVMADRELLVAAEILERPSLAEFAKQRLQTQIEGMYDSCGFMREQSNGYQHFHAGLWGQVLRKLGAENELSIKIEKEIARITEAAYAVTYPDGVIPVIGDGAMRKVDDLSLVAQDLRLACSQTGWFSWRETEGELTQQVVARYGPRTIQHGHADKGGFVWWVGSGNTGEQVIADRGLSGKNRDKKYNYSVGPKSHAVLLWPGGSNLYLAGDVKRGNGVTQFTTSGAVSQGAWNRTVRFADKEAILTVEDKITGSSASRPATQNFPLDPTWSPTSKAGVFESERGSLLTIKCTNNAGKTIPVKSQKVEDYQVEGTIRQAYTATCSVSQAQAGLKATLEVMPGT